MASDNPMLCTGGAPDGLELHSRSDAADSESYWQLGSVPFSGVEVLHVMHSRLVIKDVFKMSPCTFFYI